MSFVLTLSKLIGISEKSFVKSLNTFIGLPHRYEIFLKRKNCIFINDSKATTFEATKFALKNTKNLFWIVGGLPKKNDRIILDELKKNIVKSYIIGKNINFFKKQIKSKVNFHVSKNLRNSIIKILQDIKSFKRKNNSILLSPASASYDQFSNFEKRGEEFKKLSKHYARKFIFKIQLINYWRNIDKKIFFCFIILFVLGLFFSFSSTSSLAGERLNKDYYFFFSKFIFYFYSFNNNAFYFFIRNFTLKKIYNTIIYFLFSLLALVPIIGVEVKGAKRWLDFYFFRLQPIEILKPFFILATVKILTLEKLKNSQVKYLFSFLLLTSVIILLIDQPDLGQSILLIGSWTATVFISGVSLFFILGFFSIFLFAVSLLLFFMPEKFGYIINRLVSFIDPSQKEINFNHLRH